MVLPVLLGRKASWSQEVKKASPTNNLFTQALFQDAGFDSFQPFLEPVELVALSQACSSAADFRATCRERRFSVRLTEQIGKQGHVVRNLVMSQHRGASRSLVFVMIWLSLVMFVIPVVLATGHYRALQAQQDEDLLPTYPARLLAVVAVLMAIAGLRPIIASHFPSDHLVPVKRLLKNLGQTKAAQLLISPEKKLTMCKLIQKRSTLFRITFACSLMAFLPFLAPLSNLGVIVAVSGTVPIGLIIALILTCGHWRGREKEPTEEEIAAFTRVQYYTHIGKEMTLEIMGEGIFLIVVMDIIFCGYAPVHILGQGCAVLAQQILAMTAGALVVVALSLMPGFTTFYMYLLFRIFSWIEVAVAHDFSKGKNAMDFPQCPASFWPWLNVGLGFAFVAVVFVCNWQKLFRPPEKKSYHQVSREAALEEKCFTEP